MAIGSVLTDSSGRFSIDVDRRPPRKTRWSIFFAGLVSVSSGDDPVLHNYAAASGHDHWIAEIRVEKAGFEPARVFVEVPGRVRNRAVPFMPEDSYALWRVGEVAPEAEPVTIYLVPDGGRTVGAGCGGEDLPGRSRALSHRGGEATFE